MLEYVECPFCGEVDYRRLWEGQTVAALCGAREPLPSRFCEATRTSLKEIAGSARSEDEVNEFFSRICQVESITIIRDIRSGKGNLKISADYEGIG